MSGRAPRLAQLEEQLRIAQQAFMAEADRIDPRTATEDEVRALDAKALPLQALTNQIRRLRPIADLRRELAATRKIEHEVTGGDAGRALYRRSGDELKALLDERLQQRAASWQRWGMALGGLVLLAAAVWFAFGPEA